MASTDAAELTKQGDAFLVREALSDQSQTRLQLFYPGDLGEDGLAQQLIERICALAQPE